MDKTRQWVVLTAVVALAILAAGWFLLISPQRATAGELRDQTITQQATTAKLRSQLVVLQAQAKDLPAQQAKISAAEAKIPTSPDLPPLLRALTAAADGSGVNLLSVVPGTPAPLTAASAPSTTTATTTPTTASAAPVTGAALSSISLTMSVVGGYYETEQFLAALEELPRALRVATVAVALGDDPLLKKASGAAAPINNGQTLVTSLVANVFMTADATATPPATATAAAAN